MNERFVLLQSPTSVTVEIHLLDTNDNSPAFLPSESSHSFYIHISHTAHTATHVRAQPTNCTGRV